MSDTVTTSSAQYELGDLYFTYFVVWCVCNTEMGCVLTTCSTVNGFNVILQFVHISTRACACPHRAGKSTKEHKHVSNKAGMRNLCFLWPIFFGRKFWSRENALHFLTFPNPSIFLVTINNVFSKLCTWAYFPNWALKFEFKHFPPGFNVLPIFLLTM